MHDLKTGASKVANFQRVTADRGLYRFDASDGVTTRLTLSRRIGLGKSRILDEIFSHLQVRRQGEFLHEG